MTLSVAGKNWLAINAGVNNCFSPTGVSFVDADGVPFTMGTKDVVITFIGAHMVGKNDVIIIANTSYNGFKAINGTDLLYADATWVSNSDGHAGATLPLYCYPISTELTVSTNDCSAPCTVTGTVKWTNNGGVASSPINLSIIVNGDPTLLGSNVIINPQEIKSYDFTLENLTVGTYTVEASPDTGTTPQVIEVHVLPADIVSESLTLSTNSCAEYCNVTGSVTWINNGGETGTLNPAITFNGNPVSLGSPEPIGPGQRITHGFSLPPNLTVGTYQVCASPGPHCQTLTVQQIRAHFTSIPSGATVYVDDIIQADITPLTVIGLTAGTHTYRMTHPDCGGNEITGNFTAVIGEIIGISETFETKVHITSSPSGARIWIDDVDKGVNTPRTIVVTPGHHTYRLTKTGYTDFIGEFDITECQRLTIPASITKIQEAGMGIIIVGLIFGMLLMGKKEEKEKEKLTYY